ncbi:hypothetical protein COT65_01630 [Candidatus Shapirobacteria bacterium CG09_land_8_20_14_0_10_47_13]|uniref:5'-3' exonuclease domain-containing protein n=1 Tax=Candidatus Shapirobacteria bacterium CG09_land_8_20_14_0_10_47_13 TaxID=1974481 RepID=A0A2H0WMQ8_9BACT|nr:MAG: hypothetical protein COT65_01630 [Candidatus Shapirobacteria bacterium CG09_land_8_20_14_0_10_47_13]
MTSRLVLIDGHAILHRAYHAFPKSLTTRNGELVNAVYGFTRILLSVLNELGPKYVAVAFDLPIPTFRHKAYVGYQVQRPAMDAELKDQIDRVKEVVAALNMPIFSVPGFEADDVIGTLARQATCPVIIVTGDKDILQLVRSGVKVYAPGRSMAEAVIYNKTGVFKYLGVYPGQIVDYKALVGDSSDNYPGVPGIGPKTAIELLRKYKNLASIYRHLKELKPLVAERLAQGKESALLSQKLARISEKAPIKLDLKACLVHDYNQERVIELFNSLQFKSLINKLPGVEKNQESRIKNQGPKQMSLI